MKKKFIKITAILFFMILPIVFAELPQLHHNPWELIIYRPENTSNLNEVRCWLKIQDEDGNDVTYTAAKATYEWATIPNIVNKYQRTYYLSGGMAMHLNIKPGKYIFTVSTPPDKQYPYPSKNREEWKSNEFHYDTSNPAKVIFVYPGANDNGFYTGEWIISAKSPEFYKFTKPKMK